MDEKRISVTNASSVANKETKVKNRHWKIDILKQEQKILKYDKKISKAMGKAISIIDQMNPEASIERKNYLLHKYVLKGLLKAGNKSKLAHKSFTLNSVLYKSINAGTGQKSLSPLGHWKFIQSEEWTFPLNDQMGVSPISQQTVTAAQQCSISPSAPWCVPVRQPNLTPASQLSNSGVMTMPGLKNLGNSCYINSAIQALQRSRLFNKIMEKRQNSPLLTTVQTLFEKMENSQGDELNIAFDEFYKTGIDFTVFKKNKQHDCSQFIEYILETLHTAEVEVSSEIPLKQGPSIATPVDAPTNDSVPTSTTQKPLKKSAKIIKTITMVDYVFGGRQVTRTKCSECNVISYQAEMFRILHLAFPPMENVKWLSVQTLLDFYFAREILNNENMYSCTTCKGLRDATRSVLLRDVPNNLVLTLKRFKFNRQLCRVTKQMTRVHYNFKITLKNVFKQRVHTYELFAIIVHRGRSMFSGHYYVIVQNGKNWFIYDDESVSPTSEKEINSLKSPDTPYILFYRKMY